MEDLSEIYKSYANEVKRFLLYLTSSGDLPDVALVKKSTQQAIHQEVQRLKEPYREIFLLRTTFDLNYKEIGDIFEKSEDWARVTYYREKCRLSEETQM